MPISSLFSGYHCQTEYLGIDPVTAPTAQVNVDLYEGENYTVKFGFISSSKILIRLNKKIFKS